MVHSCIAQLHVWDLQAASFVAPQVFDPVPVREAQQIPISMVGDFPPALHRDVEPHEPREAVGRGVIVSARQGNRGPSPNADVRPGEIHQPLTGPDSYKATEE